MPWVSFPYDPLKSPFNSFQTLQIYNGLDSSLTVQLWHTLPRNDFMYARRKRCAALALAMTSTGLPVSRASLLQSQRRLCADLDRLHAVWNQFLEAVDAPPTNPQSPKQLKMLFYGILGLPVVKRYNPKTQKTVETLDEKALTENLSVYPVALPFVQVIIAIRETTKLLSVLRVGIEKDSRIRCSFNPAGTETGRFSSSQNIFGRGFNAQNITERLRDMVEAPPGFKIAMFDLEQAESRAVAYLSRDEAYRVACESGDLHTTVCRMVWKDLPWTGDLKADRALAEQPYYRHLSYRDMAKRIGHGSNYMGQPPAISKETGVPREIIGDFQVEYFSAFSGIRRWHTEVIAEIQRSRTLVTPLGMVRHFWGRSDDPATHREAVAFLPQSTVVEIVNEALYQACSIGKKENLPFQVFFQGHDSGGFLYSEEAEPWLIERLLALLAYPVEVHGKQLLIPWEAKVGFNWKRAGPDNPLGLVKWKPGFVDTRTRKTGLDAILDLRV